VNSLTFLHEATSIPASTHQISAVSCTVLTAVVIVLWKCLKLIFFKIYIGMLTFCCF